MAASHNVPDVAHQASPRDKCGHNMGPFQIYDAARAAMSGPDLSGQKAESMAHRKKACSLIVGIDTTRDVSDVLHTRQCKYALFSLRPEKWARFW